MNHVTVHGKVGWVGEKKQVGEHYVVNFSLADARKVKEEFETTWWTCAAWGFAADKAVTLQKGQDVTVFGKCEGLRSYESNGEQRTDLQLRAETIHPGRKSEGKGEVKF